MSGAANQTARRRWLDWKPKIQIFPTQPYSEPTKPSEPCFAGFEGAIPGESPEIEAWPDPTELARAARVLRQAGVRIMLICGDAAVGIWSDLDDPSIRTALRTFRSDPLPVRYLDGAGTPARYKLRRVPGEPVPLSVLAEMERHPAEPWKVRDRMLNELRWTPNAIPWAQWKAAALNRLLQELGVTGTTSNITAKTVRDGERKGGLGDVTLRRDLSATYPATGRPSTVTGKVI